MYIYSENYLLCLDITINRRGMCVLPCALFGTNKAMRIYILVCECVCVCVCVYQDQRTPLHWAAEKGHDKIVKTLVVAKADLCAQTSVSALKENRLDADRGMR
jgi:hypothetical protein